MMTKGMYSSATPEWATPQALFDAYNDEFHFNVDVCANIGNAKCYHYFTKEIDGLKQDWAKYNRGDGSTWIRNNCWMNPPYGREIKHWVKKASESKCLVVGLLPARTDTAWFWDYVQGKAEIRFIRGRLKFGGCQNSAPFPSMIAIWRPK